MRRSLLAGAWLAAACLAAFAAPHAVAAAEDDIVCRWDFDGTLVDRAGETADALSARGGKPRFVGAAEVPGVRGKAIALGVAPGDAEYLVAPPSKDLALGANYSIEAWIYPARLSAWSRVVLRWGPAPQYAYHLALRQGVASHYHNPADGKYVFAEGGQAIAGRWHQLAAVVKRNDAAPTKSTVTVYLDGRPAGSTTFDGTAYQAAAESLGIGDAAGAPSPDCRFRGYIDEVTLWNRALSPQEIAAHFAPRRAEIAKADAARRAELWTRRRHAAEPLRALGCNAVVFAERHPGRDPAGHYYANFGYSCIDPNYWLHGADGGRLLRLDLNDGKLTALVDDPRGAVRDPRVRSDGRTILFSYRKGGTHNYHLYEIGVDGSGLRQITDGPWDDVEPAWLPDGDIVFCSTRSKRYIGCWLAPSATLHRCDASGGNLRMLSSGSFSENTPAVLPDGRVLYTRWEYVNRDPVSFHHLWTIQPDGTGQMVYLGNTRPGGVFIDAKPIPNTDRIVFIHSPGHGINEHAGQVSVASVKHGPADISTMRPLTAGYDFRDPHALGDDAILAARGNELVLLDGRGAAATLWQGDAMVHEPAPVMAAASPSALPARTDPTATGATFLLADIYSGRGLAGVPRGTVKKLLVLEDLPKPANFHGGGSQPIGHGVTSTLKRILGTVPVEPDGSAHFEVPAMRSLYFAALDAEDRSIKQMRSFVTLQPGETTGCVGCHDTRTQSPGNAFSGRPAAAMRAPSRIEPIQGVPAVMDFPRDVQPILTRHCGPCHNPARSDGGVLLSGERGPVYSLSYYNLLLFWQLKDTSGNPSHGTGRQLGNDRPGTTYSSASPLLQKLDGGHYQARLAADEKRTLRLWIDSGAAFAGTYAAYGTGQVGGCWGNNEPVREMADQWPSTTPAREAVERRCGACHGKMLPRFVTDQIPLDPWSDMLAWERPLSRFSRHRIFDLSVPEKSLVLTAPLARAAGGFAEGPLPAAEARKLIAEDRARPPKPTVHPVVFADASDPDYRKLLAHIAAAARRLDAIKRFDMPGFRPNEHYVRELKRFGVLGESLDPARDPIDVYAADEAYWRSFWHRPR